MTGIPSQDDRSRVVFTARPTTGDLIANAMTLTRGSAVALLIGSFAVAVSIVGIVVTGEPVVLLLLLLGLSLVTGLFVAPIVWLQVRGRRDLVLAPVEVDADPDGISLRASYASSRQAWSVYRRARETNHAFTLGTGIGVGALIGKRGVAPADLASFRALLVQVGLLQTTRRPRDVIRPVLWGSLGVIAALVLTLGPLVVAGVGATATMSISTEAADGSVTVTGVTDLPDGALVLAQAIQWDEWQGATAAGVTPDVNTSPWVVSERATVTDGRFSVTLPTSSWPAGRGLAAGYFWFDATQPPEVIDRFGSRGQDLKGPDVIEDDVFGPTLEVQKLFDIP